MTGGIAAAYYAIPSWLVKYVTVEFLPQYIRDVLDRFDKVCAERIAIQSKFDNKETNR